MLDLSAPRGDYFHSVSCPRVGRGHHSLRTYQSSDYPHGLLHFVGGLCSACCGQRVSRRLVPLAPRLVHRHHIRDGGLSPCLARLDIGQRPTVGVFDL